LSCYKIIFLIVFKCIIGKTIAASTCNQQPALSKKVHWQYSAVGYARENKKNYLNDWLDYDRLVGYYHWQIFILIKLDLTF